MVDETRTGALRRFFVVHDPLSARSEVGDCCFETDVEGLAVQVRGGFDPTGRHSNAVIYTDGSKARADAAARIRARLVYEAELRAAREGGVVKFDDGGCCPVVVLPVEE